MGSKQAATYHGADIVTRLRAYEPESDYDGVMQEAASEIVRLRAASAQVIEVHHHDIERHAESFNEGYNTAMAQHLMTDDELHNGDGAEEWLRGKQAAAWDEGHHAGVLNATGEYNEPLHDNPYGRSSDV